MNLNYSVSFVLPMYNEWENIEKSISILRTLAGEIAPDYEIVVVDDASTDSSGDLVETMAKTSGDIRFYRLEKNTKFGGAFARGFKEATKDIIMYMDSDMPVSVADIMESYPLIQEYDIVTGCSSVKKGDTIKRKIISGVYNALVQTLFGLDIKDINSGYKIVRRELVDDLKFISRSPFVDVELFIHAKKRGKKVKQYPLVFQSRSGGRSHISAMPVILATFRDMLKAKLFSGISR
ncbi:MAG: glycosyltransferase [Candidatus Omnitrophica bacterium]|nr:glycosyltransferase [Candidatus Omnitrophota bacterium]